MWTDVVRDEFRTVEKGLESIRSAENKGGDFNSLKVRTLSSSFSDMQYLIVAQKVLSPSAQCILDATRIHSHFQAPLSLRPSAFVEAWHN